MKVQIFAYIFVQKIIKLSQISSSLVWLLLPRVEGQGQLRGHGSPCNSGGPRAAALTPALRGRCDLREALTRQHLHSRNQFSTGRSRSEFWITWATPISATLINHVVQTLASQVSKLELRETKWPVGWSMPQERQSLASLSWAAALPRCQTFSQKTASGEFQPMPLTGGQASQ